MKNITNLTHDELVSLYKQGSICIRADISKSMHICDQDSRIPGNVKAAHHFWKWIGLIMFISGPLSLFFIAWYWSVIIFAASFLVMNATRQSAGQFVVKACIDNSGVYYDCLNNEVLLITEK